MINNRKNEGERMEKAVWEMSGNMHIKGKKSKERKF